MAQAACLHAGQGISITVVLLPCLFILASILGYRGIRSVAPALYPPLLATSGAIGAIVVVGALIGAAETSNALAKYLTIAAIVLASIAIFGGFAAAERMLSLYRRKDRP